jgi:hypothetical protein
MKFKKPVIKPDLPVMGLGHYDVVIFFKLILNCFEKI